MALVRASQSFVVEGFTQLKKKKHWWERGKYERSQIRLMLWVEAICDDSEASTIIEEKIQKSIKRHADSGWGKDFEGWTSYRKYYKPGELDDYPDGKEAEPRIDYIRNWKMEKIIRELDGNMFAVLCKELGITASEALLKP